MQNDWWTGLAERTHAHLLRGTEGSLWTLTSDPSHSTLFGWKYLLTDKEAILQRWSEHFESLFTDRRTVQESSLAKIPQVDVKLELDDPPTREEIKKATSS